jgi:nucleotide-binding universal stress UspA family protein
MLVVPEYYNTTDSHLPERTCSPSTEALSRCPRCGIRFATSDTRLRAVYVIDRAVRLSDFFPIDALEDAFVDEGKHVLAAAEPVLAGVSARTTTVLVNTGRTNDDLAHTIVREAGGWDAQLIVMGTHGRRGRARRIPGSVAGRVAHITQTPLLLIHANEA